MPTRTIAGALLGLALLPVGAASARAGETNTTAATRPPAWAVKLDRPGLLNFYELNTNFYRGAQPSARGVTELKALGIKTVVDLRAFHSDTALLAGTGMKQSRFHLQPWHAANADVIRFLRIASNTNNLPLFVHCQRGADRTGMMCAMYRIAVCGWTKDQALDEMKNGGFAFYPGWKNLVRYIEQVDVEKIRREAGIRAEVKSAKEATGKPVKSATR